MADERIKDISTEATDLAVDDFIELDGTVNGSRKLALRKLLMSLGIARALRPGLLFDGTGYAYIPLGTAGAFATGDFLIVVEDHYVPSGAISGSRDMAVATLSALATTLSGTAFWAQYDDGTDRLRIRIGDGTNSRYIDHATFRALYGAQTGELVFGRVSGVPVLWFNGISLTSALSGENTVGSGAAWTDSVSSSFLLYGENNSSVFHKYIGRTGRCYPINASVTTAELLKHAQTGIWADWLNQTGTQKANNSTAVNGGTGAARAMTTFSDASATGFTGGGNNGGATYAGMVIPAVKTGQIVTMTYTYGPNTVAAAPTLRLVKGVDFVGSETQIGFTILSGSTSSMNAGAGTYTISILITGPSDGGLYMAWRHGPLTTGTFIISGVSVQISGIICRHTFQPGAIIHPDSGDNRLPLITTPGVKAVGDLPMEIVLPGPAMTADGFIHLDQPITPDARYKLADFTLTQTGTETSTITVKETSSGGATVATAALSATKKSVTAAVSAPFDAVSKKLHLANNSWASNTVTPCFVFRRIA